MRFLMGFGIGFGIALILAPAPGETTRRRLIQNLRGWVQTPDKKMEEVAEAARQRAGDLGSKIGREAAESAVEKITDRVLRKPKTT